MTLAFELVALKEDGDPLDYDQNIVSGVLDTGYSPDGPVRCIPTEYQDDEELLENPDAEGTTFYSEAGGRIDVRYTSTEGGDSYFGVYIAIESKTSGLDEWESKIKELTRNLVDNTNPYFVILSDGENIKLPETGQSKRKPSLGKITYFSDKLLDQFQIRPKETDADSVEVLGEGVLVIPTESFQKNDEYKKVASQMCLDHTQQ